MSTSRETEAATRRAVSLQRRLDTIRDLILTIENRCMAADGPVTNTRHEMTDEELRTIFVLAGGKVECDGSNKPGKQRPFR